MASMEQDCFGTVDFVVERINSWNRDQQQHVNGHKKARLSEDWRPDDKVEKDASIDLVNFLHGMFKQHIKTNSKGVKCFIDEDSKKQYRNILSLLTYIATIAEQDCQMIQSMDSDHSLGGNELWGLELEELQVKNARCPPFPEKGTSSCTESEQASEEGKYRDTEAHGKQTAQVFQSTNLVKERQAAMDQALDQCRNLAKNLSLPTIDVQCLELYVEELKKLVLARDCQNELHRARFLPSGADEDCQDLFRTAFSQLRQLAKENLTLAQSLAQHVLYSCCQCFTQPDLCFIVEKKTHLEFDLRFLGLDTEVDFVQADITKCTRGPDDGTVSSNFEIGDVKTDASKCDSDGNRCLTLKGHVKEVRKRKGKCFIWDFYQLTLKIDVPLLETKIDIMIRSFPFNIKSGSSQMGSYTGASMCHTWTCQLNPPQSIPVIGSETLLPTQQVVELMKRRIRTALPGMKTKPGNQFFHKLLLLQGAKDGFIQLQCLVQHTKVHFPSGRKEKFTNTSPSISEESGKVTGGEKKNTEEMRPPVDAEEVHFSKKVTPFVWLEGVANTLSTATVQMAYRKGLIHLFTNDEGIKIVKRAMKKNPDVDSMVFLRPSFNRVDGPQAAKPMAYIAATVFHHKDGRTVHWAVQLSQNKFCYKTVKYLDLSEDGRCLNVQPQCIVDIDGACQPIEALKEETEDGSGLTQNGYKTIEKHVTIVLASLKEMSIREPSPMEPQSKESIPNGQHNQMDDNDNEKMERFEAQPGIPIPPSGAVLEVDGSQGELGMLTDETISETVMDLDDGLANVEPVGPLHLSSDESEKAFDPWDVLEGNPQGDLSPL